MYLQTIFDWSVSRVQKLQCAVTFFSDKCFGGIFVVNFLFFFFLLFFSLLIVSLHLLLSMHTVFFRVFN